MLEGCSDASEARTHGLSVLSQALYHCASLFQPYGFRQDFFMVFPIRAYVKHVTHGAGQFWPQGYNLNKLGRGSLGDASYQISRLYALWFQTRRFFMVFPI